MKYSIYLCKNNKIRMKEEFNSFEDYYEVVLGNVSHSILPDRLYNYSEQRIVEIVQRMFRFKIPYKQAAVILETFFHQFVGMLIVPTSTDYDYFNDDFNGAI